MSLSLRILVGYKHKVNPKQKVGSFYKKWKLQLFLDYFKMVCELPGLHYEKTQLMLYCNWLKFLNFFHLNFCNSQFEAKVHFTVFDVLFFVVQYI